MGTVLKTDFVPFDCGSKFSSYSEFEKAKEEYENKNFVVLVKSKSEKFHEGHKHKETLIYKYIMFECKKGPIRRSSVAKGIRPNVKTRKLGCSFKLKLNANSGFLVVKESNLEHSNHELSEESFWHLPEKLRLNSEELKEAELCLKLGVNKKKIQAHLMQQRDGKPVILKTLHNISTKLKKNEHKNGQTDLEKMVDSMKSIPDAVINDAGEEGISIALPEPESTWPCGGILKSRVSSAEEENFDWSCLGDFLWHCWKMRNEVRASAKKLKSPEFSFAGAMWNLFIVIDRPKFHSQFGINVRTHSPSDTEFDCYCDISFSIGCDAIKDLQCNFKCESASRNWTVDNFLSDSQLDKFLQNGCEVNCKIRVDKSSSGIEPPTQSQLLGYSSIFLSKQHHSAWAVDIFWYIHPFLKACEEARGKLGASNKKLKSVLFSFGDAIFHIVISFDVKKSQMNLRINLQTHVSSDEEFEFSCDILSKKLKFNLKCEIPELYQEMKDFLSEDELEDFLHKESCICFKLNRKKSRDNSNKRRAVETHTGTQHLGSRSTVCEVSRKECEYNSSAVDSYTGTQHLGSRGTVCEVSRKKCKYNSSAVDSYTGTQHLGNEDPVVKLLQDYKNLLCSGMGSDITIKVQDKEFKAHRSVLMARSSVFASMFQHNMKENATGVVDVQDCDPFFFPLLLEFIYYGTTEKLSVENVFILYASADKYDLQDLKRKCLNFIQDNMSVDTFCETVKLSLRHSETNLLNFAVDFFSKNLKEILLTAKWQAYNVENPLQSNEIINKALASDRHKE